MKKILFAIMCMGVILTGCTQEIDTPSESMEQVTLTLVADMQYDNEAMLVNAVTNKISQIRVATIDRYAIEVYTDEACTAPANIFGTTNHKEQTSADFKLTLDKTKTYYCLLWADEGNSAYDTGNLKTVKLSTGKQPSDAYCAKAPLSMKSAQTIALKRAVALISLKDKNGVEADKALHLKYAQFTKFNVMDKTAAELKNVERNVTTVQTGAGETITTFYLLAPQVKTTFEFTFDYNAEGEKTIDNIPLQANYTTSVKGIYAK